jgi:hypothetical protein
MFSSYRVGIQGLALGGDRCRLACLCIRASSVALGKAHCKPRPILLKIAQNLEGVHQILLKNGKILPHPPTLPLKFKILEGVWEDVGGSFHF